MNIILRRLRNQIVICLAAGASSAAIPNPPRPPLEVPSVHIPHSDAPLRPVDNEQPWPVAEERLDDGAVKVLEDWFSRKQNRARDPIVIDPDDLRDAYR
jgi:hypothetical protein